MSMAEVEALRDEGYTDAEILDELGMTEMPGQPKTPFVETTGKRAVRKPLAQARSLVDATPRRHDNVVEISPGGRDSMVVRGEIVRYEADLDRRLDADVTASGPAPRVSKFNLSRPQFVKRMAQSALRVRGCDWWAEETTDLMRDAAVKWALLALAVLDDVERHKDDLFRAGRIERNL